MKIRYLWSFRFFFFFFEDNEARPNLPYVQLFVYNFKKKLSVSGLDLVLIRLFQVKTNTLYITLA